MGKVFARTDLPLEDYTKKTAQLYIFQPHTAAGLSKEDFLSLSYSRMIEIIESLADPEDLELRHLTTFKFKNKPGEMYQVNIERDLDCRGVVHYGKSRMQTVYNLSCGKCSRQWQTPADPKKFGRILFELLLKQVFPSKEHFYLYDPGKMGLVGIMRNLLLPSAVGQNETMGKSHFGFCALPGMETLDNFGGFDVWVRRLEKVREQNVRNAHRNFMEETSPVKLHRERDRKKE